MNSFNCSVCKKCFIILKDFIIHLKNIHSKHHSFSCSNCCKEYDSIGSLKSHIIRKHMNSNTIASIERKNIEESMTTSVSVNSNLEPNERTVESSFNTLINSEDVSTIKTNTLKLFLNVICNEKIPRTVALSIINGATTLYKSALLQLTDKIKSAEFKSCKEKEDILIFLNSITQSGDKITEYMLLKYLKEDGLFYDADYVIINSEQEVNFNSDDAMQHDENISTAVVFPLLQAFKILFSETNYLDLILDYNDNLKYNIKTFENFIQSKLWEDILSRIQNKSDFTIYLPLFIFFDDFNANNALGSHANVHKIGGVYAKIPCVPEHLQSKICNIFLLMLFYSKDRKVFGNRKTFLPLIEQLNILSETGILLPTLKRGYSCVKIIPCLLLGDNLGLNSIMGFVECFISTYYCRLCKMSKNICQKVCSVESNFLRNTENYSTDVEINDSKMTGIKENSVWNNLLHFHVTNNFVVDVMHDLLEGVCYYDFEIALDSFINKYKFFTLETLNERINKFNYGPKRNKNKPPNLFINSKGKIKMKFSASEMLNFVDNFPLYVGDLVECCDEWMLLTILKDIVDITLHSNFLEPGLEEFLKVIIQEHNEIYLSLSNRLQPKFHNLLHYSHIMSIVGPLKHVSSIRFESFHQIFKKVANCSNSRVNFLKTCMIRYQLKFANLILNYEDYFTEKIKFGKTIQCDTLLLQSKYSLNRAVNLVSFIEYNEILYENNVIVLLDFIKDELLPEFGLIEYICFDGTNYFLCIKQIYNHGYDSHFKAYNIQLEEKFCSFCIKYIYNLCKKTSVICNINGNYFINW